MNHLKVVFALTLVVLGFSLAVFGVNEFTAPMIQGRKDKLANAAKFEVLPTLDETTDADYYNLFFTGTCPEEVQEGQTCDEETYDFTDYSISKVNVIDGKGYIYEVTYPGYSGGVTYLVALDTNAIVTGFKIIAETESTDLGHKIVEDDVKNAFPGLTLEETYDLDYDTLAGATAALTWGGLIKSLKEIKEFHGVNFEGIVLETSAEKLLRLSEEITSVGAVFADVTADYDVSALSISKVETVDADQAMLYTVQFTTTYSETPNKYIVAVDMATSKVLGLRVITAGDTAGYGSTFAELDYDDQFTDMTFENALAGNIDAMAGTSGAPLTTGALKSSIVEVIEFHKSDVLGVVEALEEAPIEKLEAAYPTAVTFTSIYADMTQDAKIINIYEAKDGSDTVIGYVYYAKASGVFGATIKYVWSMDASGTTIALDIVDGSESWNQSGYDNSWGSSFTTSPWLEQFEGIQFDSILTTPFDAVAGVSETTGGMNSSLAIIATYHTTEDVGGAE